MRLSCIKDESCTPCVAVFREDEFIFVCECKTYLSFSGSGLINPVPTNKSKIIVIIFFYYYKSK